MTDAFTQFPQAQNALPADLLEAMKPHAVVVRAKAGRTLVSPDATPTAVYLVAEGRAQVALLSAAGHEVILRDLSSGDLFGELAVIDLQSRSTSIFALDDCVLISLPGQVFRKTVFENPSAAEWLSRRLVAQVRELTTKVFELNVLRVPSRLHCELLRLCESASDDAETPVIDPSPTHAELASRIGTHREAVTREMGFLVENGVILQQRRRLTVIDLPALARLVRAAATHTGATLSQTSQSF